jgi:hypothetical protein
LVVAGAVCVAQGTALLLTLLFVALAGRISPVLGMLAAIVGVPMSLGYSPATVHARLLPTRWAPATSLRGTVLLALSGLALGHVLGALVFESGHLRGGGMGSLIGAALGCVSLLFVANLRPFRRQHCSGLNLSGAAGARDIADDFGG